MKALAFVVLLLAAATARAHYLWIEAPQSGAVVYFGEYDEKLHERSPGRLDDIRAPRAWSVEQGGRHELRVDRGADGFALVGARTRSIIVEETAHAVRDWTEFGVGIVKPLFYARHAAGPRALVPSMTLDVVPAKDGFGAIAVYFRGKPLAKAKLEIYAPNGWKQERRADDQGIAAFSLPWRGQYVVEVTYLEKAPGEYEGAKYEALRHRATLTFVK
jgi:hypothetical protein